MKDKNKSTVSRRRFIGNAATFSAISLLPGNLTAGIYRHVMPVNSSNALPIGVIAPFSFRGLPGSAEDVLGYLLQLGMHTVELQNSAFEPFAGAPERPPISFQRGVQLTPEQQAENQALRNQYAEDLRNWRISTPPSNYDELRKKYNDEGVEIRLVKFDGFNNNTSPEEIDYCFNAAKALGAAGMTTGLTEEAAKILGPFADKHQFRVGLHNQNHIDPVEFDALLENGKYLGLNFDLGHHIAGSDIPLSEIITRYEDRIVSLHLTDRNKENASLPFGQGDTPLIETLRFCASRNYNFGADIDLEYQIPEGSNAMIEVGKCAEYCRTAFL